MRRKEDEVEARAVDELHLLKKKLDIVLEEQKRRDEIKTRANAQVEKEKARRALEEEERAGRA